jgi:hypothetical protein
MNELEAQFRVLAMALVWGGAAGDDGHCIGRDVSACMRPRAHDLLI